MALQMYTDSINPSHLLMDCCLVFAEMQNECVLTYRCPILWDVLSFFQQHKAEVSENTVIFRSVFYVHLNIYCAFVTMLEQFTYLKVLAIATTV